MALCQIGSCIQFSSEFGKARSQNGPHFSVCPSVCLSVCPSGCLPRRRPGAFQVSFRVPLLCVAELPRESIACVDAGIPHSAMWPPCFLGIWSSSYPGSWVPAAGKPVDPAAWPLGPPSCSAIGPCDYSGALSHARVLMPWKAVQIQAGNISEIILPGPFRVVFLSVFNRACRQGPSRTVCLRRPNSQDFLQKAYKICCKGEFKKMQKNVFSLIFFCFFLFSLTGKW